MIDTEKEIDENEIEIDLYALLLKIKKKWWFLAITFLIGIVIAGLYTIKLVTPLYQSSSLIYMRGSQTNKIASLQDLQIGAELTKDYEVIFRSRPILEKVIQNLNLDMSVTKLNGLISMENPSDTRILKVSVKSEDPYQAKDIVNELVTCSIDSVKEIDAKEPYVVEKAIAKTEAISPSLTKNVVIGGLLGILVSMGTIVLEFIFSDRIESSEDAEKALHVPVLGTIPENKSCQYDKLTVSGKGGKHRHGSSHRNKNVTAG